MSASMIITLCPVEAGAWLHLDGEKPLIVTACTGRGPFTLMVRPVTRWDYWQVRLRGLRLRLRGWADL